MAKTAKNRAEDLFQSLQKKAKAFAEAEEGLVHTAKDLMQKGLSATDVTNKLEDLVGKVRANAILEKLDPQEALAAFNGYRDDVERRVDLAAKGLLESLPIASKKDFKGLQKEVVSLKKKVESLKKQMSRQ